MAFLYSIERIRMPETKIIFQDLVNLYPKLKNTNFCSISINKETNYNELIGHINPLWTQQNLENEPLIVRINVRMLAYDTEFKILLNRFIHQQLENIISVKCSFMDLKDFIKIADSSFSIAICSKEYANNVDSLRNITRSFGVELNLMKTSTKQYHDNESNKFFK